MAHRELEILAHDFLDSLRDPFLPFLIDVGFASFAFVGVTFSVVLKTYAFGLV